MSQNSLTVARLRACMDALSPATLRANLAPHTLTLAPLWVRFETPTTLLWQLAQTAQTEGIEDDAALQAECDVYATLLPTDGLLVTLGQIIPDSGTWGAQVAALPDQARLVCNQITAAPTSVTPMGAQCQIVFHFSADMRACFGSAAAVVHCQFQTLAVRLPDGLRRALSNMEPP